LTHKHALVHTHTHTHTHTYTHTHTCTHSHTHARIHTCMHTQDCSARVWDTRTGRQIAFVVTDTGLRTVCFAGAPCPDVLVLGDVAGHIHFLDFPPELHAANAPTY